MKLSIKIFSRVVSVFIIIMLVMQSHILSTLIDYNYLLSGFTIAIVKPWIYFILNAGAAIGLMNVRNYGFWFSYMAIGYTSFLYGYSYIPWLSQFMPYHGLNKTMSAINVLLVLLLIVFHVLYNRYTPAVE